MVGVVGVLRVAPRGPLTASFSRAATLSAGLKVTSADLGAQSKRSTFLSMTSFLTLSRFPLPKEGLEKVSVVRLPRWVELLFRLKAFDLLDQNERLEPKLFVEAPIYVEEVKPRPAPRIFEFTGVVPLETTGIDERVGTSTKNSAFFFPSEASNELSWGPEGSNEKIGIFVFTGWSIVGVRVP